MSKRIIFTFDDASLEVLKEASADGSFSSLAETVRCSLIVFRALQNQARDGYSRVVVEKGSKSREVVLPRIVVGKRRAK